MTVNDDNNSEDRSLNEAPFPQSNHFIEYSVTIKDDTHSLTVKDTSYNPIVLSTDNPLLQSLVQGALDQFGYDPHMESPEIVVKFKMVWQS
jgi:hypothetical protein